MHYRTGLYALGSGQFRTACKAVVLNVESTYDRREITCDQCRQSEIYQLTERLFGRTTTKVDNLKETS